MWEFEWQKKIQTEPRINKFIERLYIVTPLNPCEATLVDVQMPSNSTTKYKMMNKLTTTT